MSTLSRPKKEKERGGESKALADTSRFNPSVGNVSTTIKEAFEELASETDQDGSIGFSDATLKARAVERTHGMEITQRFLQR